MKIRAGFVSNSSSSSFVVTLVNFSDTDVTLGEFFKKLKADNEERWKACGDSLSEAIKDNEFEGCEGDECDCEGDECDESECKCGKTEDHLMTAILETDYVKSGKILPARDALSIGVFSDMGGEDGCDLDFLPKLLSFANGWRKESSIHMRTADGNLAMIPGCDDNL